MLFLLSHDPNKRLRNPLFVTQKNINERFKNGVKLKRSPLFDHKSYKGKKRLSKNPYSGQGLPEKSPI